MSPPPLVPPPLVPPLQFEIVARCGTTKARVARMVLPHHHVDTPVFMPVGTQGTMKGLTAAQLRDLGCQIVLGNTYHLGNRPVRLYRSKGRGRPAATAQEETVPPTERQAADPRLAWTCARYLGDGDGRRRRARTSWLSTAVCTASWTGTATC